MEYLIEKNELKKISLKFRMLASRLLSTESRDGVDNVNRLLSYIKETPIIYDFILKNNVKQFDIKKTIKEKGFSGRFIIPCNFQEEISFVYQLMIYISENVTDYGMFAVGYAPGNKLQDMSDGFNNDVIRPFINHIIEYLEEIKIDMGIDEMSKIDINISDIKDSRINVAQGNSTINVINSDKSNDIKQIEELTKTLLDLLKSERVSDEVLEETDEILETINDEINSKKPKKNILKFCNERLSEISSITSNSAKVGASIVALIKLVEPFIA